MNIRKSDIVLILSCVLAALTVYAASQLFDFKIEVKFNGNQPNIIEGEFTRIMQEDACGASVATLDAIAIVPDG